jgi:hypothetical protein
MKQSESIAKLAVALVKAQGDMKSIVKDSTNPAFKSSYASLEATVDTVRPILARYGLCTLQGESAPETDEGKLTGFNVETIVLHESGEWISTAVFVPVEKPSAQGAVSALTYGRRAGLRAVFTLADTDDDGETAQNHAPRTTTQSRPVSSTPTPSASPRPAATPTGGAVTSNDPPCPVCHGKMWDNREGKKNPKAPDFKCRDKSCEGVVWPPKPGAAPVTVPADDEPEFDDDTSLPF